MAEQPDPATDRPPVAPEVGPEHGGLAGDDRDEARASAQQRGFAGPVGATEEHDLAASHVEIDAGQGRETSEQRDRGPETHDRVHDDGREATGGPPQPPNRPRRRGGGGGSGGRPRLARALGIVGRTLIGAGVLILLFVAYLLWGTGIHEARAQHRLEDEFEELLDEGGEQAASTTTTTAPDANGRRCTTKRNKAPAGDAAAPRPDPPEGSPVAHIVIGSIGVDKIVVQGVSLPDLKEGPGHYPGTPYPGEAGNTAIAGHRTTYGAPFNRIDEIPMDGEICLKTVDGIFRYKVVQKFVVKPNQTEVLAPTLDGSAVLTLTTCNPKYSARERYIVRAKLDSKTPPPKPRPQPEPETPEPEVDPAGLSGEGAPNGPAILWGLAAALVAFAIWMIAHKRRPRTKWLIYAAGTVPFLVVLYAFFENFSRLLPSNF